MKSALFSNETGEDTTPSGDTEYNFSFPSFPVRSHSTPASSDTADFTFDSFSILIKHSRISGSKNSREFGHQSGFRIGNEFSAKFSC